VEQARPARPAQVLALLLEAESPRSGQEMAERLGCSRATVGKLVDGLRAAGFDIETRPTTSYSLLSEPAGLLPARVEARLTSGSLGLPFIHLVEIDSTNLEARRRAEAGLGHGACLSVDYQSAGRGRMDRCWQAPRASCLLFSLLLRPAPAFSEVFSLTSLVGVAVCRAVEDMSELRPMIKWPNDVYLDGRKLAGILTEFTCRAERLDHVVVGVGLNVNLTAAQLAKLPAPAASLRTASGRTWDRALLLAAILDRADAFYRALLDGDGEGLTAAYNSRSWLQGRRVQVRDGQTVREGVARGVAVDGALLLHENGCTVAISHGDVSVLGVDWLRTSQGSM
jgi:BirA family biotin operon repressor/biotin-[acetyl-CoA-carboxylase] ligase